MGELLVEEMTQPRQLVGIAQILGLDDLVARRGEGLVELVVGPGLGIARQHAGTAGTGRVLVAGAGHHLAFGFVAAGLLAILAAVGLAALERRLRARCGAVAALGLAFAVLRLVAFAVSFVAVVGILAVAEVEILDEAAHDAGIGVLVEHVAAELGEILADAAFEIGPPCLDDALRGARRRLAGELLAGEEADRLGERHVAALGHPLVALAAIALVEHGGQVARDADHAARAQRLDARLLDGIVDRPRRLAARHAALMDRLVVVAQAQRQRIGRAAELRGLGKREIAARCAAA